jgi:hypothetical protein
MSGGWIPNRGKIAQRIKSRGAGKSQSAADRAHKISSKNLRRVNPTVKAGGRKTSTEEMKQQRRKRWVKAMKAKKHARARKRQLSFYESQRKLR